MAPLKVSTTWKALLLCPADLLLLILGNDLRTEAFCNPRAVTQEQDCSCRQEPRGAGSDAAQISADFWLCVGRGTSASVAAVADDPFAPQRWRTAGFSWWISPTVSSECRWRTSLFLMKDGTSASSTRIRRRKFTPPSQCWVRTQRVHVVNLSNCWWILCFQWSG